MNVLVLRSSTELQQINQASQAATSAFEEVPGENFLSGSAILDVDGQTLAQEDFELPAKLVGILESRSAIGGDEEKGFERLFVEVRRFRLDHLNGHDAEGPHIDFAAVLFLLDDFGGHPIRRANHSSAFRFLVSELSAETKIGCKAVVSTKQWIGNTRRPTNLDIPAGVE